jgi:hypothetical protein
MGVNSAEGEREPMTDIPADERAIDLQPRARPTRPVLRRVGWILVAVTSLLIGAYAVLLVASGFALVPEDVAGNRFPVPSGYGSTSSPRGSH